MATDACDAEFWASQRSRLFAAAGCDEAGQQNLSLQDCAFLRSERHACPLIVVGVFGRASGGPLTSKALLDQLHFRDSGVCSGACEFEGFGGLQCVYRDEENVLYVLLDSPGQLWSDLAGDSDTRDAGDTTAAFLASCGEAELSQVADLTLLFNLCHMVWWLCPGSSPRVDSAALSLLAKLQEVQAHPTVSQCSAECPVLGPPNLLMLHAAVKMPLLDTGSDNPIPTPRPMLESAERSLDVKWRNSLKRCGLDPKHSEFFRFPSRRSCAAVVPGPFTRLNHNDIFKLFLDLEGFGSLVDDKITLTGVANPMWPIDRLRILLRDSFEQMRAESRDCALDVDRLNLKQWCDGARCMHTELSKFFEPLQKLPFELNAIVFNSQASKSGVKDKKEKDKKDKDDLSSSLRCWAFSELLFSLSTSQKGFEEGSKAYCHSVKKHATYSQEMHEQQLQMARRSVRRASWPFSGEAEVALQKYCEDYRMKRMACSQRSLTGRLCILTGAHTEEHRSTFRPTRVCLCGKSQLSRPDAFEAPHTPEAGLPPTAPCCHNVRFIPFLPLSCDFVADPVLVPTSPRLAKIRPGQNINVLPSALPEANGFVGLVADPPIKCNPVEGSRLPGFSDSFQHMSRWRLPTADDFSSHQSAPRYAYVGFEYTCAQGHRFFVPPLKHSGFVLNGNVGVRTSRRDRRKRDKGQHVVVQPTDPVGPADDGEFKVTPLCSHRLYVPCLKHAKKDSSSKHAGDLPCVAQLTRLWLQTPPIGKRGELIEAAPRVSIPDPKRGKGPDGQAVEVICTGGKIALPHDSLVQIVLPSSYVIRENDGKMATLPGFWELDKANVERCRLLPYAFWVVPCSALDREQPGEGTSRSSSAAWQKDPKSVPFSANR